jgi:hypothetical protein
MGRRFRRGGEREEEKEEEEEAEEEEFKRCWKMSAPSFPGRVLSAHVYNDPATDKRNDAYRRICVCLSCTHSQENYVIPCQMWPTSVK